MKPSFTYALALTVVVASVATGAHAQQAAPTGMPAGMSTPVKNHPCMSVHQSVQAACNSDPCSQACKEAHQQMKACRAANHLPPIASHKNGGGQKHPCAKSPATPQGSGNAAPGSQPPANP